MKLGKKLLSILMTMIMVLAMVVPVMAETPTTTDIVIQGGADGSEYSAWRLLDAEENHSDDPSAESTYYYEVNEKYKAAIGQAMGLPGSSDSVIITYIAGLDDSQIRAFADAVFAQVKRMAPDAVSDNDVFDDMPQGYYLIAETKKAGSTDTISKVMLDTKGEEELTVTTKEDTISFEKKVEEKDDTQRYTNLQDGADYDIGDMVSFQLKGTLPSNFNTYTKYHYHFVDKLAAGFLFDADSLKVYIADKDTKDINAIPDSAKEDITDAFTVSKRASEDIIDIICQDLKASGYTFNAETDAIFVRYEAELTANAIIGSGGNTNEAWIDFSDNPYDVDSRGETVHDIVVVFTYEFDVNKVDGLHRPLKGAGFTLYKKVYTNEENTEFEWQQVGSQLMGQNMTTFEFKGLDSGEYKLVETTVPGGYNKADDIEFTLTAEYVKHSSTPEFIKLETTVGTVNGAVVETTVENLTGVELPETGGIGTTIFYVAGGILVVGAAVMLIAKKRTENEE